MARQRKAGTKRLGYAEAKREALEETTTAKIYGIPLADAATLKGHTVILWCGVSEEGHDEREVTNRVWHLPDDRIVARAAAAGFVHEGHQVELFTLRQDVVAIEEIYVPVRLDGTPGGGFESLARRAGGGLGFGRGRLGLGDIPVTIFPDGSRPTQSPPLTIFP